MNIAIMFNGQFRWFDSFQESFEKNFKPILTNHNVKYFAHFWNDGNLIHINKFINICDPLILSLEYQKTPEEVKNVLNFKQEIKGNLPNQTYCMYKVFELVNQYEKYHNINFDLYIRMRPDIAFQSEINFDFDDESVYFKHCHEGTSLQTFVCDFIYFTKSKESAQKMTDFGFCLDQAIGDPKLLNYTQEIYCPEELLANHLKNKNIPAKLHNFKICLARDYL